jgi:hypothetical protein
MDLRTKCACSGLVVLEMAMPACRGSQPGIAGAASSANVPAASVAPAASTAPASPAGDVSFIPVPLPGARGGIGFDDLTFAPRLHRVLAPAGRTGKLDLIDPATREVGAVDGFATAEEHARGHEQGTTSADEGGEWIFAIDRTTKRLHVVDPKERKIVATTPLAGSPDYVRWVEPTHEVWVTEPDSDRIEVFSVPATGAPKPEHVAFIKVDGGPESLVIDKKRQRAFTHLWKSTSVAVDLHTRSIVGKWQNGCAGSRGIALEEARGLLFVGCGEGKAVTLDVDHDGKQVSTVGTGNGVDIIAYSPSLMHLYVPGAASATLSILGVGDGGQLTSLATVPTAKGAHCVTADDRGGVWICDPEEGRLLFLKDSFGSKTP